MQRDFTGYGKDIPRVHWPNGARIAVSVVVNYEEGSEYSLLDGDPYHETNNEVPSPVPPGQRDLYNESFFEYGSRVGVWRLLDLFDQFGVKTTFYCCALALERNPQAAREIVSRGHEVCGHGYRWQEYHSARREDERKSIDMTVQSLLQTTGQRPVGWFTRYGPSVHTRELIAGEGGFIYDSLGLNDDLPYYVPVQGKAWLVVPYSFETNDARFWRGGLVSVDSFYEYLRDTFDCLYQEGRTHPKMMSVGLHCRLAGRPGRTAALVRFIDYAKRHERVWMARRVDIARHWHKHHRP
jgi:allantoinase